MDKLNNYKLQKLIVDMYLEVEQLEKSEKIDAIMDEIKILARLIYNVND